jgi:short-subunit dehydrogenase
MSSFFNDKVVAITGGSDGIGKALVDALLAKGAKVATCARNQDKLYQLQLNNPGKPLHLVTADVSAENDCRHFIDSAITEFGGIDIIINNAGISMRSLMKDTDPSVIKKLMDINFMGTVYCTKFALDSIIARKGVIVGVSSIAGYRGLAGRSGYSASKFALQGWLEALKTELMDEDVHVMWVCPGFTASNIRQAALDAEGKVLGDSTMDEGKMMTAQECANHILHAIEKKKRTMVLTGQGKRAVWLNKLFPSLADKMVHKFYIKKGKLIR